MKLSLPNTVALVVAMALTARAAADANVDLSQVFNELANAGVITQVQEAYEANKDAIHNVLGQVDTGKLMAQLQQLGVGAQVMNLVMQLGGLGLLLALVNGGNNNNNDKREANPLGDMMQQMMIQGMMGLMFGGAAKRDANADAGAGNDLVNSIVDLVLGNLNKRDAGADAGSADDLVNLLMDSVLGSLNKREGDADANPIGDLLNNLFAGVGTTTESTKRDEVPEEPKAEAKDAKKEAKKEDAKADDEDIFAQLGVSLTAVAEKPQATEAPAAAANKLNDLFPELFAGAPQNVNSTLLNDLFGDLLAGNLSDAPLADFFFEQLLDLIFYDADGHLVARDGSSLLDEILSLVGEVLQLLFAHAGDWISELLQDLFGGSLSGSLSLGDISFGSLIGGIFELIIDSLLGGGLSLLSLLSLLGLSSLLLSSLLLLQLLANKGLVFSLGSGLGSSLGLAKKCCCLPKFKAKRMQQKRMLKKLVQAKVEHNLSKRLSLVAKRDMLHKRMFDDMLMKRMAAQL